MHTDQQEPFRVGVTRDVRLPDGSFVFAPYDLSMLEVDGVEWSFLAEDARPVTPELLAELDGLYHFSAPVTAESVEGVDRLVVLARHGVGLDFVDVAACTERGIAVTITPQGVTRPMASAAVTLVLALAHRLRERDRALHEGDWGPGRFVPPGVGLSGRTLGVIGYGRIGQEVVRLLGPWEMRVLVTQRTPVVEDGVSYVPLETLLAEADFIVVACPLTDETRGLLDARRLALMKPTAFLVNVSRGAIVDQAALVEALRNGRLAGAGLDVVDPEPLPADDPLLELPNVVGAPHSLGYSDELLRGCVEGACRALLAVAAGRVPPDLANPAVLDNELFAEKLGRFAARTERSNRVS
jgi:phosphoglycerate dehydrogenase-like enzyme